MTVDLNPMVMVVASGGSGNIFEYDGGCGGFTTTMVMSCSVQRRYGLAKVDNGN